MFDLAKQYQGYGFNLVPLGNDKRPVMVADKRRYPWKSWAEKPQGENYWDKQALRDWWANVQGLAAICGPVSGHLACMDFDGLDDVGPVVEVLTTLELPPDYPWVVRSPGGGFHLWVRCPDLDLPKGMVDRPGRQATHVELRYTGHYVALPGSLHPSGHKYAWVGKMPSEGPQSVSADALLAAYDAVTVQTPASAATPVRLPAVNGGGRHAISDAYARAAFEDELNELARTPQGQRNEQLNRAAFALGQLVGAGALDEYEVAQALEATGLAIGLGEGEVRATVRSGLSAGMKEPRQLPERPARNGHGIVDVDAVIRGDASDDTESVERPRQELPPGWPYAVLDGRIVFFQQRKDDEYTPFPVADFTASIIQEIRTEDGDKIFVIQGEGKRAGKYQVEIPAETIGEDRRLRAVLEGAVGALDGVYAGMTSHLGPAIKKLTDPDTLQYLRRYHRTGWLRETFLLPGREDEGVEIQLGDNRLPYAVNNNADLDEALLALESLLDAVPAEKTTILLAHILTGPLSKLAGWDNERHAVFVRGLTGTFKTSVTQMMMCVWGAGFAEDEHLIRWGEGATTNAIMKLATRIHDLPLFVDNFKPNTGGGTKAFISLVHAIMEGGEKARLNRAAQLVTTEPIFCWPLFTGEDLPSSDSASIARVLVVPFERQDIRENTNLTAAQERAGHLSAIGEAWLSWLETKEGREVARQVGKRLPELRGRWAEYLYIQRSDLANPWRVATNLALNELAFSAVCQHPRLGPLLNQYKHLHIAGLEQVGRSMAESTAESLEALRFLAVLRELLATGRALLVERQVGIPARDHDRERHIGWSEGDGSAYLLTNVAVNMVERHTKERFHSAQQLYSQLDDLGFLVSSDKGRMTKSIKVNGKKYRTIHVSSTALTDS